MNPQAIQAVCGVLRSVSFDSVKQAGSCSAVISGARFPGYTYAVACALYEAGRRHGASASLCDDRVGRLVRRTWGRPAGVAA